MIENRSGLTESYERQIPHPRLEITDVPARNDSRWPDGNPAGAIELSDAELQRITTPKLFVTSDQNDPFTSDTYHMFDVTPQPKEERIYPGRRHGLALFQGTSGPDLLSALRQFLQHYAPVN